MKYISLVNKWGFCIVLTAFSFGIEKTVLAQNDRPSETKKQEFNNNKQNPSDAGKDKSLGSSVPGSANRKPKAGSDNSLGGSTDKGFTNTREDQSNKGGRGDPN